MILLMKVIAHRGYSLQFRDNSKEAIKEAIHREYDGVEIDVQLCATGEIVLYHDVYLGNHFICDMSLDTLREHGVCTLQDIYDEIPSIESVLVIIDIKGVDRTIAHELVKFYSSRSIEHVYFCSFNRKILYDLPRMFKLGSTFETTFNREEFRTITRGLSAVIVHWTCLDDEFIWYCKLHNIRVYTYTHKEDKELEYMYRYYVDGIITNGF